MQRRKYLAALGAGTAAVFAGCGGGTGGNNSSGGTTADGEATSEGDTETEAAVDTTTEPAETATTRPETTSGGETSAATETPTESATEASTETETETQAATMTQTESSGGGSSGDVSLDEQDIVDGVTLDSSEWYNEDDGLSTGVRGQLTTSQEFDFLFINAQIYNSDGTRIGEGSDSSESIPSGESLTFDCIMVPDDPSAVASYNIQVSPNA